MTLRTDASAWLLMVRSFSFRPASSCSNGCINRALAKPSGNAILSLLESKEPTTEQISSLCHGMPRRAWLGLHIVSALVSSSGLDLAVSTCASGRSRSLVQHLRSEPPARLQPLVSNASDG